MNTIELKNSLHRLIDKIEDERLLQMLFEWLGKLSDWQNSMGTDFWDLLTEAQKVEIKQALAESYQENELVDHADFFKPNNSKY
jgi:hypothetical protein